MNRLFLPSLPASAAALSVLVLGAAVTHAAVIPVGNASFETPDITFAGSFDSPGNSAAPWDFTEVFPQQVGAFDNTSFGSPDYVDNASGAQMGYLFAGGNTLFQDITDPSGVFQAGQNYTFTIGAGGSSSLPSDARLSLRLYYRDGSNNKVTVALAGYDFNPSLDPGSINHLFDYNVSGFIDQNSPAIGKQIGIEIGTVGTPAFAYWDVDNARLEVVPEPATMLFGAAVVLGLGLRRRRAAVQA